MIAARGEYRTLFPGTFVGDISIIARGGPSHEPVIPSFITEQIPDITSRSN
jgi:hypothetical protein